MSNFARAKNKPDHFRHDVCQLNCGKTCEKGYSIFTQLDEVLKLFLAKWKVNICDCQGYVSLLYIASALLLWKGLMAWFSAVCTCRGAGASYTEWSLFFFVTLSYCHSA